jgi:hypothetical protein
MANRLTIVCVIVAASALDASSAQTIDWTGTWTSRNGQDVDILRHVPGTGTARGWNGFAEALARTRDYIIVITQTLTEVVVTFPGGASNMLTTPGFAFGAESRLTVVTRGEWWTKHITSAHWVGRSLELSSTSFSGWWSNSEPNTAQPRPTDFRKRLTLIPGSEPDELLLRVQVSDEKGELEYLQKFYRAP